MMEKMSLRCLSLHTRAQCKKCDSVGWRDSSASNEFALQVQSPEPTLNNNNKSRVWWYALVTPGLERWRQVDQWKQLSLASSKPVSDPASIKMGRILRTVFEVVLWHSDTCTNTKRKETKHSSKSIFVLILCKVYILFEFKSAMLPLMTQFSNVYF